jgi:hypothetical protein
VEYYAAAGLAPVTPSQELVHGSTAIYLIIRSTLKCFASFCPQLCTSVKAYQRGSSRVARLKVSSVFFCIGHPAGSRVSGPFNYLREHIYSQPHPSSGDLKVGVYCSSDSSYSYEFAPSNQRSCILKQVMRIESGILPKPGSRFTVCLCVICQLKERSTCSKSLYQFSRSHPMCCPYFK